MASLKGIKQLLGRVVNDREPDAEKNTPETEWRRQRNLQVRLTTISKALLALVEEVEEIRSPSEAIEEVWNEVVELAEVVDPSGVVTGVGAPPSPGHPAVPGGGNAFQDRTLRALLGLSGGAFARTEDQGGMLELLRGALHQTAESLAEFQLDAREKFIELSAGGGGGISPTLLTAKGSMIAASAPSTPAEVTVGANDTVLMADSTDAEGVVWNTVDRLLRTVLTTKGDLIARTATNAVRKAVGANNTILIGASADAAGVDWQTLSLLCSTLLTTKGDLLIRGGSPGCVRLAVGADGQVLTADSTTGDGIKWATAAAGSFTMTIVEVDLGSTPLYSGKFTFAIASSTAGNHVLIQQAIAAYTNKGTLTDEAEMDVISVTAVVSDVPTVATAMWTCSPKSGPVAGNVKFAYRVAA